MMSPWRAVAAGCCLKHAWPDNSFLVCADIHWPDGRYSRSQGHCHRRQRVLSLCQQLADHYLLSRHPLLLR